MSNTPKRITDPERLRLERQREGQENWRLWGPYLAERAWGHGPRGLQRLR